MIEPSVLAMLTLLEAAEPGDWPRLLASHRESLTSLLRSAPRLPDGLVEHAFAERDPGLLRALASNEKIGTERPGLRARLVEVGTAAVLTAALTRPSYSYGEDGRWETTDLRRMLSRPAADDPLWSDPDLAQALLHGGAATALVTCRAPGVAAKAYGRAHRYLSTSDRLRALLSVAEADGIEAVGPLLQRDDTPQVPKPLDIATLRAAVEHAEGTEGLLAELADGVTSALDVRESVDWPAILAAHARKKFRKDVVAAFTALDHCPVEVAKALGDVERVTAFGDHDWLIDEARPAKNVLKALRGTEVERLRGLVGDVLRDDVGAWLAMRVEVLRHKGTIAELFALVETRIRGGDLPTRPTPKDVGPPEPGKRLGLKIADAAYLTLLDAATADVRLALLPTLDGQAAHALLTQGRERHPEWTDHLIALGDTTLLTCLADDRRLSVDEVARLMALDVPEVSHALGARHRDWPPRFAVACPDTELRKVILTKVHVRGETPRLRIVLNQWEDHGPDELPSIIKLYVGHSGLAAFPKAIRQRVEGLLAEDDRPAALASLRARVEKGESVAEQIAKLRKASEKYKPVATEHHAWRWEALAVEHEREPFSDQVLWDLSRLADCPEELKKAASEIIRHWESEAEAARAAGATPLAILTAHPLAANETRWLRNMLTDGHVTWTDVFAHARPAEVALSMLKDDDADARAEFSELVKTHLGTGADTWQLALAMLPGFAGSPLELLRTTGAAVG